MKTNLEFWERVNLALDERRDPLADEGVQDAIANEPELVDELVALEARLAALPAHRESRRIPRAAAAAAIVVALGAIAFEVARTPKEPVESEVRLASAPEASLVKNEILECSFTITTELQDDRETVVTDRTGTRRIRELASNAIDAGSAIDHATLITEVTRP